MLRAHATRRHLKKSQSSFFGRYAIINDKSSPKRGEWVRFSVNGRKSGSTPLITGDPFFGTKLLAFSIGRDLGALKGLTTLQLETHFFTYLLEFSIGRDLRTPKGLTTLQLETHFFTYLLKLSTGRDWGL